MQQTQAIDRLVGINDTYLFKDYFLVVDGI